MTGARGAGLALALGVMACSPAATPVSTPGHAGTTLSAPCELATRERARLPGLIAEGRLDRALRVLAKANRLCPGGRGSTWEIEVEALAEVGRYADAKALSTVIDEAAAASPAAREAARRAAAILADRDRVFPETDAAKAPMRKAYGEAREAENKGDHALARDLYLKAWSAWHPNGQALYAAGHNALLLGEAGTAQRLFDRALVELEKVNGANCAVDFPNGFTLASRVQWSPDGRLLAVVTDANTLALIGFPTRRELLRIKSHAGRISTVVFAPDGKTLASASPDGSVEMWDVATGQLARTIHGETGVIALSPDGLTLAWGTASGNVKLLELASASEPITLTGSFDERRSDRTVRAIAFSPDGSLVAWGGHDGSVQSWSRKTGSSRPPLLGHVDEVRALAFSPNGRKLASASNDYTLRLWDIPSGTPGIVALHGSPVTALAFTPNGATLVSVAATEGSAHLWSTATGEETSRLQVSRSDVESISLSPDGTTLALATFDDVQLWSTSTGVEGPGFKRHADRVSSVAISPDGALLASSSIGTTDDVVRIWTLGAAEPPRIVEGEVGVSLAFAPDGNTLALGCSSGIVDLREVASGKRLQKLSGHEARVRSVAFSPDGELLASGSDDRTARLWSTSTGKLVSRLDHDGAVASVAFTPDGRRLASGGADASIHLWDIVKARPLIGFPAAGGAAHPLALSPDGRTLATEARNGVLAFWDMASGGDHRTLPGQQGPLTAIAFSRDGSTVASSSIDGSIRLRSARAAATETPPLLGHTDRVTGLATAPHGDWLASSSWDGTVRLWSMTTGEQLLALRAIRGKKAGYAFTPTGRVELYGDAGDIPICRVGVQSFPFELCRERFLVPGLRALALAGDRSYLDP